MTHRCPKRLKKPTHEFLMILNQLVPFLKKSWKNLKKSFVIILQPSQFSILFFQKSKIPLKLCWNTKNHGFNPTRSDCNWPWHLMKLCWSHGRFLRSFWDFSFEPFEIIPESRLTHGQPTVIPRWIIIFYCGMAVGWPWVYRGMTVGSWK